MTDIRTMQAGPELDVELCILFGWNMYQGQHLSTSWNGAGFVVKEMQKRGWEWASDTRPGKFRTDFFQEGRTFRMYANTFPHSVALAAIAALRSEAEHGDLR